MRFVTLLGVFRDVLLLLAYPCFICNVQCELNSNYINIFPLLSFCSESFGNGNFVVADG